MCIIWYFLTEIAGKTYILDLISCLSSTPSKNFFPFSFAVISAASSFFSASVSTSGLIPARSHSLLIFSSIITLF